MSNLIKPNQEEIILNTTMGKINYVGFWKRLLAAFIDLMILAVLLYVFKIIIALMTVGIFVFVNENTNTSLVKLIYVTLIKIDALSPIIITWIYCALFESLKTQGTVGKLALGIKVINFQGNKISFVRASLRYLGKIISLLTLLIGFIMIGFTKNKQGLHDMLVKTYVVNK